MYKFIFDRLIDPLSLPIPSFYEYIILFFVGIVAFKIAWEISPGGRWGSEIHWTVRIVAFVCMWLLLYCLIVVVKWIIVNWMLILGIVVGLGIITSISYVIIKKIVKSN